MQFKTEVTNTLWTSGAQVTSKNHPRSIPEAYKWAPTWILNAVWEPELKGKHFWRPWGRAMDLFGMSFGSRKSFETRHRSAFKTQVTWTSGLEASWDVLDTDFEILFQDSA